MTREPETDWLYTHRYWAREDCPNCEGSGEREIDCGTHADVIRCDHGASMLGITHDWAKEAARFQEEDHDELSLIAAK